MTTDLDNMPEYLNADEAAKVARSDVQYITRQCKNGNLKATNLKGKLGWRIHRDALREFLAGGTVEPARVRPPRERKRAR